MSKNYEFNPETYKTVANNVKKYREEKGYSIEELSKYTKIEPEFLKEFENSNNDASISIYDLYKISVILEISINHFFDN